MIVVTNLDNGARRETATNESGVYQFPLYATSQKAWFWLTLWGMAAGFVFRMVKDFYPV